ncbi:VanW family protein [Neobacillus sp. OS1-32]|uniref:VanW family protein n=1 Tax=Neobacillus sp. OS1-32 TaxID=3070682 RepID=UPI0027DF74A9|nr:VanW family protein [Neobacillus sp. OS1-32]WML31074.1 VanW family protein [Neobacillus sp. OS1-32]
MNLPLIFAAWLAIQPVHSPEDITITKDGIPVTTVNRLDFFNPYIDFPIFDVQKYQRFLDQLDKQISFEAKNARLDHNGNIIPEIAGFKVNRQAFTEQIYANFFDQHSPSLEVPLQTVYPKVDSELLSDIRSFRIGRYFTSFNPQNKNRSYNIKLAAEAINNYVVFPGETFSFNKVVGKRTKAKGYLKAPVIVRGEFSEDIGGGICQVSSTLFNAVDSAGLAIVQRFSHSRDVPYIPPGRDATVSWYGPDFVFKNKYQQPVLIRARTMGRLLIINLYSSEGIQYKPRKIPRPPT